MDVSKASGSEYGVFFYDENKSYISCKVWITSSSYTVPSGAKYVRLAMRYSDNRNIESSQMKQLEGCVNILDKQYEGIFDNGNFSISNGRCLSR